MSSATKHSDGRADTTRSRVLVTAFDSFGDLALNPSQRLLAHVADRPPGIVPVVLPTSYLRGWDTMSLAIRRENPAVIVMLGYARGVQGLRLEQYAHNADTAQQPDNDGQLGTDPILQGAPKRLEATALVGHLAGLDDGSLVSISQSAGGFVCNHIYFRTLAMLAEFEHTVPCVFVHVGDWQSDAAASQIVSSLLALVEHM